MNADDTQALRDLAVRVLRQRRDPEAHQLAGTVLVLLDEVDQLPTRWAYDQTCKALHHHRAIADEATAALVRSSLNADEAEQLRRRFETPLASTPEEPR
jgi:hypothetical protein